jgi:hypothetical protein
MNTKKFLIGGIAGGIVYFLLGWVVYGMLLSNFMKSAISGIERVDSEVFWSLILGNILLGFVLSYVINRAGIGSVSQGFGTGAIIGLLFSSGFDLIMYGTTNLISLSQVAADILAFTVISAISGAVVAMVARPGPTVVTA